MKNVLAQALFSAMLADMLMHAGLASAQLSHFEVLSNLPFSENRPTQETAQTPRRRPSR